MNTLAQKNPTTKLKLIIARRVQVYGNVQGVFYRAAMREWCTAHGVTGWVQNEPGGSVTMHVEAEEPLIVECLVAAKKGSVHARVDRCVVSEVLPEQYATFTVRQ